MSTERKKRIVGMTCCITGCNNISSRNPDVKFYSFPSSKQDWKQELRMKWIDAVKRNNLNTLWQPKKSSYVCSEHFVGGRKSNIAAHPAYVPRIFPVVDNKQKTNTTALAQYERVDRREACKFNESSTGKKQTHALSELEASLFSMEILDRASPELWPEKFPGMSEFTNSFNTSSSTKLPYSKELSQDDQNYLHQLASLPTTELVSKVKQLHDIAYQLGVEETKEITRGKYLNLFNKKRPKS